MASRPGHNIPTEVLFKGIELFYGNAADCLRQNMPEAAKGNLDHCFGIIRCFDHHLSDGGYLDVIDQARLDKLKQLYDELDEKVDQALIPDSPNEPPDFGDWKKHL